MEPRQHAAGNSCNDQISARVFNAPALLTGLVQTFHVWLPSYRRFAARQRDSGFFSLVTFSLVTFSKAEVVQAAPAIIRRRRERWFYVAMSIAVVITVFAGFAPTYYLRPHFTTAPLIPLLHLHGFVFTSWIVLFNTWPMCSMPVTFGGGITME